MSGFADEIGIMIIKTRDETKRGRSSGSGITREWPWPEEHRFSAENNLTVLIMESIGIRHQASVLPRG